MEAAQQNSKPASPYSHVFFSDHGQPSQQAIYSNVPFEPYAVPSNPGPAFQGHAANQQQFDQQPAHGSFSMHDNGNQQPLSPNKRQRTEGSGGGLDAGSLKQYFSLPIDDAAKKVGVSASSLKRVCQKLGIAEWPFRKIQLVEKKLVQLEAEAKRTPCEVLREVFETEAHALRATRLRLLAGEDCEIAVLEEEAGEPPSAPPNPRPPTSDSLSYAGSISVASTLPATPAPFQTAPPPSSTRPFPDRGWGGGSQWREGVAAVVLQYALGTGYGMGVFNTSSNRVTTAQEEEGASRMQL